jgi:hypothetical protein
MHGWVEVSVMAAVRGGERGDQLCVELRSVACVPSLARPKKPVIFFFREFSLVYLSVLQRAGL